MCMACMYTFSPTPHIAFVPVMNFDPVDLIARKRDAGILSAAQIQELIEAYTAGDLPDYQMSAFLMAAYLNGMSDAETAALTRAMLYSGEVLDLSGIPGVKVDKHSTGGVGDKVSLLLAPMVAACGVPVPMISGRGLGHSGGTLDKLESIPGFQVNLSVEAYKKQLADIGVVMIGQTAEIAPADRKIYALRDVTATIANPSFIAPSIMSKKIAAGVNALVLDVKCGKGAFMKTEDEARRLAEQLVAIGAEFNVPAVAWMTAMEDPLGYGVGNWPEVDESIRCLQGEWIEDLMHLTLTLAGEMICLGGKAGTPEDGYRVAKQAVDSGRAFDKLVQLVRAQGGDATVIEDPGRYSRPEQVFEVRAPSSGYVAAIDALEIGRIAVALGAGRRKKEDAVDPQAGMKLAVKRGDGVEKNGLLATLYCNRKIDIEATTARIRTAISISNVKPADAPLLLGKYTAGGWREGG